MPANSQLAGTTSPCEPLQGHVSDAFLSAQLCSCRKGGCLASCKAQQKQVADVSVSAMVPQQLYDPSTKTAGCGNDFLDSAEMEGKDRDSRGLDELWIFQAKPDESVFAETTARSKFKVPMVTGTGSGSCARVHQCDVQELPYSLYRW